MPATANYGWTIPTVGGDSGAWGTILNAAFNAADASLKTIENLANTMLPKSGGTMTGGLITKITSGVRFDYGPVSGAIALDQSVAQAWTATVAGATTFSISNPVAGSVVQGFGLYLTNGGAFAVTWPASVKWHNGTPPVLTASGKDHLVFISYDAGATWHGVVVGQAIG